MNKAELVKDRLPRLKSLMSPCRLCPRECKVKRAEGETGFCKTADTIKIAAWAQHRGEEPPISGTNGSGTIFSSNCTLGCFFCQNFPFSQLGNGRFMSAKELSQVFDKLAAKKVHNFNFVTPTHVIPMLLEAWLLASPETQKLPIVYNCSGYESAEVVELLESIVDIFIPDIKYSNNQIAAELSKCGNYVENNRKTLEIMYQQVGDLQLDSEGMGTRGLIIRHLVLPENQAGSEDSLVWLKEALGVKVNISLMSQYFPAYQAHQHDIMRRKVTTEEYLAVLDLVEKLGFENVFAQDPTERGGA
ncbi:MAG: radical SAM protein [Candidatus Riflebacteria bacterium]